MTSTLPPELASCLKGLNLALNPTNEWEKPPEEEVHDDCEGETEALLLQDGDTEPKSAAQLKQLQNTLMNASKGVTEGTDGEYRGFVFYMLTTHGHFPDPSCPVKCRDALLFWWRKS